MYFIYDLIVSAAWIVIKLVARLSPTISLFVKGRKNVVGTLKKTISQEDDVIWIHAASLGEYEQGLPILEELRSKYPNCKLLLTFFSPSGFEIRKNTAAADIVTYLPLDSQKKVTGFLDAARPKLALFIKYEIWPNYLFQLCERKIPILLVSALFKADQIYFKWYGGFMRNTLTSFYHLYVQNDASKHLLQSIGLENCTVTGDTRFDRVLRILEMDNRLGFMDAFCQNSKCFVAGSTWPEDEKLIVDYINSTTGELKFVIAPHTIKKEAILRLQQGINKPTITYTEHNEEALLSANVLILDTIGILTKVYSYAGIAYVGGGFATGLHNTLEPAVFGIPVVIGPNYSGFLEAEELVALGGMLPVNSKETFTKTLDGLALNSNLRQATGNINSHYIAQKKGATHKIMKGVSNVLQTK